MDTLELLTKARALIAEGWTQHAYARDMEGRSVGSHSPSAVAFCALGALDHAHDAWDGDSGRAETLLSVLTPDRSIGHYNDKIGRTKEEVLAVFDQAIEVEQERRRG